MKILLLGANGSLGKQFQILFKSKKVSFLKVTRKNFNFKGNYKDIKKIIKLYSPNFIINCSDSFWTIQIFLEFRKENFV